MSLFHVQEWWRSERVEIEECGHGCLCVANIDNASDNSDKVIVGSYSGVLHIYAPSKKAINQPSNDVVLEVNLNLPILQISAGRYLSISADLHLAVLHPRLLSVYKITCCEGAVDHGHQYKIEKLYQHKLERSAANMTHGPFGGVKDRDFICVQSLDGALSIFEHESFTFTRFLPGFLLPGPLAYNPYSDSYLTGSSSYFLECYSYQVLAVAADSSTKEESQSVSTGKRIKADWTFNLGDYALDIAVITLSERKPLIMVLGEHSLLCLECSGELLFMKKFEYSVSCFNCYPSVDGKSVHTVICTHSNQLQVFNHSKLLWGAKIEDVPVNVTTGTFSGSPGMLVMVNDQCQALCNFLGTTPSVFTLPRSKQREMSLDRIDMEVANLTKQIVEHHSNTGPTLISNNEKEDLKLAFNVSKAVDKKSVASQHIKMSDKDLASVSTQVILKVNRRIIDVQITIPTTLPLCTSVHHLFIPAISEFEHPPSIRPAFFLESYDLPPTLEQEVLVYYKQPSGIPQVQSTSARLPLTLVAHGCQPVKKLDYKVTLESNKPCINLMELFPDFVCSDSGPNCIGIEYHHGPKATILTSKSSNRYRIQCESFNGLFLITDEMVHRITNLHPNIYLSNQEQPYLEEYVRIVDHHFRLRQANEELRLLLEQRAHQYRAIQRRLLTRFKDKTPQSLKCLDTLLEGTHTQLLALADAMEEQQQSMRKCCNDLSRASQLIVLLTKLWRNLTPQESDYLASVLSVSQTNNTSTTSGWEEIVDSSITTLLKTTLSRSDSNSTSYSTLPSAGSLEMHPDTVKIKKHLAILIDRLAKGAKLIPSFGKGEPPSSSIISSKVPDSPTHPDEFTSFDAKKLEPELDFYKEISNSNPPLPADAEIRVPSQKSLLDHHISNDELYNHHSRVDYEMPLDKRLQSMEIEDEIESPYFNDDVTDLLS